MKPLYTERPSAWDRAQRIHQTPAEYASPVERHVPQGMSGAAKVLAWGITALFALLLAVHLVLALFR